MADEEKPKTPASAKEDQQQEEKEQDTAAAPGSPETKTPVPPPGSKPSSSRSQRSVKPSSAQSQKSAKPGSARSQKSGGSGGGSAKPKSPKASARSTASPTNKSTKSSKSAKSRKGKTPDEEPSAETPAAEPEEQELPDALPEGCVPIFLATKTQEIFSVRMDEDIKATAPYRLIKKEELLKDIFNRAAVSDFQPFKKIIEEYPEDEMLIGYDADFKHGQNFVICTKQEAKEELLKKPEVGEDGEGGEGGGAAEEEEDTTVYTYIPPTAKEWVSQGAEIEIDEESLQENRKRLKMMARRVRREFGAPYHFTDRNVADAKDGHVECTPYQDGSYDLKKIELDKGTQAIPEIHDMASQTDWKFPRNANTQYEAREFSEAERAEQLKSEHLNSFMESVLPRFELAMQQNEIVDIFFDDWMNLGDDDGTFGVKSDTHLKEYQSFTDLQFSKDKTITCIDWHPTIKGVVAVSVAEQYTYNARIDNAAKVIMTPSLILIWSFTDPIHPQLLLEAPDDIYTFKFCPTDPNIIAGGCINGQVVLWDIGKHADRLKTQRGGNKRKILSTLPGFEDENALDTPIVRYCAVSSIEFSHRAPITDVLWVPDHMEINRMGVPQENKSGSCVQLMTCAVDHAHFRLDDHRPKDGDGEEDRDLDPEELEFIRKNASSSDIMAG